ncbi:MAG: cobalt-zinc-cadmium efflux system outer membrane protein [Pseudoalteromonas tetraodonis]|jgi:cobalt-zinc-cadmium efflux system outer membrane protein
MEVSKKSPLLHWLSFTGLIAILLSSCRSTETRPAVTSDESNRVSIATSSAKISSAAGLSKLVDVALQNHPEIDAAEARVRRMMAKVPQVASLPDPKFKASSGSMAETAAGRVKWMAGVEQALPFPGKLREMAKAAGKDAEAAAAQLEAVRLSIAAQVEQAYWNLYLAARTTSITGENQDALKLIRESVDTAVAANKANQSDQLRLASEAGRLEQSLIGSHQREASARSRLNSLLNRPTGSSLPTPKFQRSSSKRDLKSLIATAELQHPSVKAADAELQAFRHRLKRAELEGYPDFFLGAQHAAVANSGLAPSANGRDQLFATVGVSIPLWRAPRKAMLDEARAGIEESSAKIGAARSSLRYEVEDAWLRANAAGDLITLFEKQIIPESKQAFDGVLTGFSSGEQKFVDTIDAWRQLLGFQLQQAGNEAELGKALAALRKSTGTKL